MSDTHTNGGLAVTLHQTPQSYEGNNIIEGSALNGGSPWCYSFARFCRNYVKHGDADCLTVGVALSGNGENTWVIPAGGTAQMDYTFVAIAEDFDEQATIADGQNPTITLSSEEQSGSLGGGVIEDTDSVVICGTTNLCVSTDVIGGAAVQTAGYASFFAAVVVGFTNP